MQLSVSTFLGMVKDRVPECLEILKSFKASGNPDISCIDPTKHDKIKAIFTEFLLKFRPYGNCEPTAKEHEFKCPVNEGTDNFLVVSVDPRFFEMNFEGNGGHWSENSLFCGPLIKETGLFTDFDQNVSYHCRGFKVWFDDSIRNYVEARYSLIETINGVATESFELGDGNELKSYDPLKSNCNDGLPLFEKFMSQESHANVPPPETDVRVPPLETINTAASDSSIKQPMDEAPEISPQWTYFKLGAGVSGTLYFGFKTALELKKIWDSSSLKAEEKSKETVKTLKREGMEGQKPAGGSKMKAIVYAAATVAFAIFTQATYQNELTEIS